MHLIGSRQCQAASLSQLSEKGEFIREMGVHFELHQDSKCPERYRNNKFIYNLFTTLFGLIRRFVSIVLFTY